MKLYCCFGIPNGLLSYKKAARPYSRILDYVMKKEQEHENSCEKYNDLI